MAGVVDGGEKRIFCGATISEIKINFLKLPSQQFFLDVRHP
jgi:hypothetical protein